MVQWANSRQDSDRRRHRREKVFEIIALHANGRMAPCVVDDVSTSGALVTCEMQLTPGLAIEFEIEDFGRIPATVVHVRDTLAGIEFNMDEALAARYAAWLAAVETED